MYETLLKVVLEVSVRAYGEVEVVLDGESVVKLNVITEKGYLRILETLMHGSQTRDNNITVALLNVNDYKSAQDSFIISGDIVTTSNAHPNVSFYSVVPKTETTPLYIQYAARFDYPTSDRTFKSIALVSSSNNALFNYARLDTECTQKAYQVLDVFYRIKFDYSDNDKFYNPDWMYRILSNPTTSNICDTWASPIEKDSLIESQTTFLQKEESFWNSYLDYLGRNGYSRNVPASRSVPIDYLMRSQISLSLQEYGKFQGQIINAVSFASGPYFNIKEYPVKAIQNHKSTSNNPFIDIDHLADGTGSIQVTGASWDKPYPMYYKISIKTAGNATTAKYKVSSLPYTGLVSNDIMSMAPIVFPTNVDSIHYDDDHSNSEMYDYGDTEIIVFDKTGFTVLNKYNGNVTLMVNKKVNPLFDPVEIKGVAADSLSNIYVVCAQKGVYKFNGGNPDEMEHFDSTNTPLQSSHCYAIAVGYGDFIYILTDVGLASTDTYGVTWRTYDQTEFNTSFFNYEKDNVRKMVANTKSDVRYIMIHFRYVYPLSVGYYTRTWYMLTPSRNSSPHKYWKIFHPNSSSGTNYIPANLLENEKYYKSYYFPNGHTINPTLIDNKTTFSIFYSDDNQTYHYWDTVTVNQSGYTSKLPTTRYFERGSNAFKSGRWKQMDEHTWNEGNSIVLSTQTTLLPHYAFKHMDQWLVGYTSNYDQTYNTRNYEICDANYRVIDSSTGANAGRGYSSVDSKVLENGLALQYVTDDMNQFRLVHTMMDNTHIDGGALGKYAWNHYGWNGSEWVRDVSEARPAHSQYQPLIDNLNVRFVDDGVNPYVLNDYYTFVCAHGTHKDNSNKLTITGYSYIERMRKVVTAANNVTMIDTNLFELKARKLQPYARDAGDGRLKISNVRYDNSGIGNNGGTVVNELTCYDGSLFGDFTLKVELMDITSPDGGITAPNSSVGVILGYAETLSFTHYRDNSALASIINGNKSLEIIFANGTIRQNGDLGAAFIIDKYPEIESTYYEIARANIRDVDVRQVIKLHEYTTSPTSAGGKFCYNYRTSGANSTSKIQHITKLFVSFFIPANAIALDQVKIRHSRSSLAEYVYTVTQADIDQGGFIRLEIEPTLVFNLHDISKSPLSADDTLLTTYSKRIVTPAEVEGNPPVITWETQYTRWKLEYWKSSYHSITSNAITMTNLYYNVLSRIYRSITAGSHSPKLQVTKNGRILGFRLGDGSTGYSDPELQFFDNKSVRIALNGVDILPSSSKSYLDPHTYLMDVVTGYVIVAPEDENNLISLTDVQYSVGIEPPAISSIEVIAPDDLTSIMEITPSLDSNTRHHGTITPIELIQRYRFDAVTNETYELNTWSVGDTIDTIMILIDQNYNIVSLDDDSNLDGYSRILFSASYTGTYYVEIRQYNAYQYGNFELSLHKVG